MSTPDQPAGRRDPVATAADLNETLKSLDKRLTEALQRERFTRRLAVGLACSLVIDLIVTGIVTVAFVRSSHADSQSRSAQATVGQLHQATIAACQAGNESRRQQVQLWEYLYSRSVTPSTTPAQKAADAALIAYVRKTFAPRDCAAVYRLHPSAAARSAPVAQHRPA